jgi:hypothetical protein
MDLLEGVATHVRSSIDLGDADADADASDDDELEPRPRSPKYIVRFELSDRDVAMTCPSPISIADGDRVLVAGSYRAGILHALAYRNETTLAEGDRGWWPALALSIILLVVGLAMLAMTHDTTPAEPIPLALATLFLATSLYVGYHSLRVLEARNRLRQQVQCD